MLESCNLCRQVGEMPLLLVTKREDQPSIRLLLAALYVPERDHFRTEKVHFNRVYP